MVRWPIRAICYVLETRCLLVASQESQASASIHKFRFPLFFIQFLNIPVFLISVNLVTFCFSLISPRRVCFITNSKLYLSLHFLNFILKQGSVHSIVLLTLTSPSELDVRILTCTPVCLMKRGLL